jgi:hypothetical protein
VYQEAAVVLQRLPLLPEMQLSKCGVPAPSLMDRHLSSTCSSIWDCTKTFSWGLRQFSLSIAVLQSCFYGMA